jgi:hypothetical protein
MLTLPAMTRQAAGVQARRGLHAGTAPTGWSRPVCPDQLVLAAALPLTWPDSDPA